MLEAAWDLRGMRFTGLRWGVEGSPAGEALTVLLHGFLDHAGAWEGVAGGLTGERVAIDHRGHGRSGHNPASTSYIFADYIADLDALLDQLSPERPVRLIGHSMGGTMATLYAGARPERVESLVSLDGLGIADGVTGSAIVEADPVVDRLVKFLDGVRAPARNRPFRDVGEAAERLASSHPRISPEWARRLAERGTVAAPGGPAGAVIWSFDPAHRHRSPIPYRHAHHIPLLRRIACPVLALHAQWPVFGADDVERLEREIQRLEAAVVPNTSHMMHLEEPEAIATLIRDFWRRIPAPGQARPPPQPARAP